MSLLLLFQSAEEGAETPSDIPEVLHLFRSSRRYDAAKIMIGAEKDPEDIFDYEINWSKLLDQDTINTSTWVIPTGILGISSWKTTTTSSIWVSEGTEGRDYALCNRITTTDGRTFERTLVIPVRDQ